MNLMEKLYFSDKDDKIVSILLLENLKGESLTKKSFLEIFEEWEKNMIISSHPVEIFKSEISNKEIEPKRKNKTDNLS